MSTISRPNCARFPDAQIEHLDELIVPLVTARAPGLLGRYGVGPDTAAATGRPTMPCGGS